MASNRPPLDLGALGGTPEELLEPMKSLTETFSTLLGSEFDLVDAPSGSTDCKSFFRVPLLDPEAYIILEHEISHPFAGTDLELTEAFRKKAVERLLTRAGIPKEHNAAIPYKRKLEGLVHHRWNVLEDWRCCSIWEELYPGGADLLKQRWKDIAEYEMEDQAQKDLITYLGRVAAGVDTDAAPDEFKACAKHMKSARARVELVDNKACLALTARLIDDIADELLKQFPIDPASLPPPQEKKLRMKMEGKAKLDLLNSAVSDPGQKGKGHGDNDGNPLGGADLVPDPDSKGKIGAKQILQIQSIVTANDKEVIDKDGNPAPSTLQKLLDAGAEKMFQRIETAKKELGKAENVKKEGPEEKLLGSAKLVGIKGNMVTPSQKLPSPTRKAGRLRRHLENVKMKKETRRVWEGDDLDIDAVIQAKLLGRLGETKLFKTTKRYGGMDLLLLLDVSGSMYGWGLDLLEQAVADLEFASRDVHVRLHMWGFSSELYFFRKIGSPKNVPGMQMMMTSMVQALDAAQEWASASKRDRAVLMITDGFPTSCRGRRSVGDPVTDLNNVLREMRGDGVVVSILGIGHANKDYYDGAFGKGRYGLVSTLDELPKALEESARVMIQAHIESY